MKAKLSFGSKVLCAVILMGSQAGAVYPPSTSVEEVSVVPLGRSAEYEDSVQRFSAVTLRLEQKERVLDGVIQKLSIDEQALKNKSGLAPVPDYRRSKDLRSDHRAP